MHELMKNVSDDAKKITGIADERSNEYRIACILLASAVLFEGGEEVTAKSVADFTGFGVREVSMYEPRLREQRIWTDAGPIHEWFGEDGGCALLMDVNVVLGHMERFYGGSETRWKMTASGIAHVESMGGK